MREKERVRERERACHLITIEQNPTQQARSVVCFSLLTPHLIHLVCSEVIIHHGCCRVLGNPPPPFGEEKGSGKEGEGARSRISYFQTSDSYPRAGAISCSPSSLPTGHFLSFFFLIFFFYCLFFFKSVLCFLIVYCCCFFLIVCDFFFFFSFYSASRHSG